MKTTLRISKKMILFLFIVILNSCATNKPFSNSNIILISNLKIVRYKTPDISQFTLGGQLAGVALGGAIGSKIAMGLNAPKTSTDYGEIIMFKFADRAQKEIPNWPKMSIDSIPVKNSFTFNSGTLLVFNIDGIMLHARGGFLSDVKVKMVQPDGRVLWQKKYFYSGRKHGRYHTIKEFKKDNLKLLIEEIEFAANATVAEFMDDLKNAK